MPMNDLTTWFWVLSIDWRISTSAFEDSLSVWNWTWVFRTLWCRTAADRLVRKYPDFSAWFGAPWTVCSPVCRRRSDTTGCVVLWERLCSGSSWWSLGWRNKTAGRSPKGKGRTESFKRLLEREFIYFERAFESCVLSLLPDVYMSSSNKNYHFY